jgi:tripartite-type tricarboxylate transporter receptor subunit TctC
MSSNPHSKSGKYDRTQAGTTQPGAMGVSASRRRLSASLAALGAAAALPGAPARAQADSWPQRPIRLVVGYLPGGGTDVVARLMAPQLSKLLGQGVIVDNRPGAGSVIGTDYVVRAAPDGYTLLFTTSAPIIGAPLTVKNLPYDPGRDLIPIGFIGGGPYLLVANPNFPPNTLQELVAYCKAHPGEVNFGIAGTNTADFFFLQLLNIDADIKTVSVMYKGSSALLNDLIGGQIQYTLDTPGTTLPMLRSGRLKAIAVLSEDRLHIAPEIPTAKEAGYPRLVGGSWYGLMAPKGTPDYVVQKVWQATKTALASPEVVQGLAARDVIIRGLGPQEFGKFIQDEYAKYKEVADKLGMVPQ